MLKKKIITNTSFNVLAQILQFCFGIVLARLLIPNDFGVYGISLLIIETSLLFTLKGFSTALIQAKEVTDKHFKIAFAINLVISILLIFVVCISANALGDFFHMPLLPSLLRWQVCALFVMAFEVVSTVKLLRETKFKELGISLMASVFANGVVSILFIILKFGAMSLVFGYLAEAMVRVLICLRYGNFKLPVAPQASNSRSFGKLFSVGFGVSLQQIFNHFAANVDYFWLGRLTNATELGLYTRAYRIMSVPIRQV
ncbi:MAG: oligosaccharide flippase family protein, partial [Candidatus Omnitrophota bacterium]